MLHKQSSPRGYDFSAVDELIERGVKTAVIDIDNTVTRSHIGMLYLFLQKQRFSSSIGWHSWKICFVLFIMLPLVLIDQTNRELAQRLTYRLYRKFDRSTLEQGASALFEQSLKTRFIGYVHDLIYYLKSCDVEVVLLSTNLQVIAKHYASYFDCGFIALPSDLVYDVKLSATVLGNDFKGVEIAKFEPQSTLAIADSKHDMPVFKHAAFSAVVGKKRKSWVERLQPNIFIPSDSGLPLE